jgi:hypothetical protein
VAQAVSEGCNYLSGRVIWGTSAKRTPFINILFQGPIIEQKFNISYVFDKWSRDNYTWQVSQNRF